MRWRRRGVDLDPPVAAGTGSRESVVLGEGGGEVAVVGVRGGRGGEVAVGVREGGVRRGGRRRAEVVAPVGAVVVAHGRWWEEAEEGGRRWVGKHGRFGQQWFGFCWWTVGPTMESEERAKQAIKVEHGLKKRIFAYGLCRSRLLFCRAHYIT